MISARLTLDQSSVRAITAKLKTLDDQVKKKVARAAMKATATSVGKTAKTAAPVRSGKLRKSLFIKVKAKGTVTESRAAFGKGAPYANFLEYGSRAYRHSGKYGRKRGSGSRIHNRRRSLYKHLFARWWRSHIPANEKILIASVDAQMTKILQKLSKGK